MALANFSDLQAAIADYLARSDLTARIPDFIRLAEVKFDRILRTSDMEATATLTADANGAVPLPSDFRDLRSVVGVGPTGRILLYLTPQEQFADTRYPSGVTARGYSIVNRVLYLVPATAATVTLVYTRGLTPLSNANSTNWLMTSHPDVYLYGALAEAEPFLKNDDRIALWKGLLSESVTELIGADKTSRWGGARMALRGVSP